MQEGKRIGIVKVSFERLAQLLNLPDGARIVAVSGDVFFLTEEVAVKVEHPRLFLHFEGTNLTAVEPKAVWRHE